MSETPEKKKDSSRIRPWLQLVRFPAVFTAMSDIFLGFLLTHSSWEPVDHFFFLLFSSSSLYFSGMLFNDLFDREVDAQERPFRPIPSGRVSLKAARFTGIVLVLLGIGFALLNDLAQGNQRFSSTFIAILLTGAIFAYNGGLKKTVLGPVAMGSCRFLNVMLGASAATVVWSPPQTYLATCLGIYIAGLTWFARNEAKVNQSRDLIPSVIVINIGLLGLFLFLFRMISGELALFLAPLAGLEPPGIQDSVILYFLGFIILILNRRLFLTLRQPSPERIQQCVRTMLLSYIILNASLILFQTGSIPSAIMTISLLIPATVLSRWIFVT